MGLRVDISEFSDFCFGVKRAISLAEKALKRYPKPVSSLGPLIHNRQVVSELSKKGLNVITDCKKVRGGTVVTRSHGIHPDVLNKLKKKNIDVVDATCPFVKNAQMLAERLSQEGYKVIIVGDKGHPEIKSLKSFSGNKAVVIATKDDAKRLKFKKGKIGVVAQTTQSLKNFMAVISELLKKSFDEIRIFNTICSDVNMRQNSTERFSRDNDLVIVVGGKNSANTRRLYEICKCMGRESYHIEGGCEIKYKWLEGKKRVGVVSGASTPRWLVNEVVGRLRSVSRDS
jgi:4-hydroxy-3-methylbut-2-enyl diphosphate reductase